MLYSNIMNVCSDYEIRLRDFSVSWSAVKLKKKKNRNFQVATSLYQKIIEIKIPHKTTTLKLLDYIR